ncbi:Ldh family oxidoreductase [Paenarthrobacter sp. NPDC090520]|uniref:Ldh family oxidoreductase n=1 Tax=Paenarthrobacter sp. NPDC090520 TaxID=3364382 RepID=UPI003801E4D4
MTETWDDLRRICESAIRGAGGNEATVSALVDAAIFAERNNQSSVGIAHLIDHLDSIRAGRLNPSPRPIIETRTPMSLVASADAGAMQVTFAMARRQLAKAARDFGIAVLSVRDGYTAGGLAFYTNAMAEEGFVALAASNSPALMSLYGSSTAATGTNPLSFALPGLPRPRVFDQAASEVAWVQVREAAQRGDSIPLHWANDAHGHPTQDPHQALKGTMSPSGGIKGANIALMVEMLSVLSGANFSTDAPQAHSGYHSPRVGLWLMVLDPSVFDPDFVRRVDAHFSELRPTIGHDFGRRQAWRDIPNISPALLGSLCAEPRG